MVLPVLMTLLFVMHHLYYLKYKIKLLDTHKDLLNTYFREKMALPVLMKLVIVMPD